MKTLLLCSAIPLLAACLTCQEVPPSRSLSALERAFEDQRLAAMQDASGNLQQFRTMIAAQIEELGQFLVHEARGDDRFNGRLMLVDKVDAELVVAVRNKGKSWREIAEAHPAVRSSSGMKDRQSVGSIRRAYANRTFPWPNSARKPPSHEN